MSTVEFITALFSEVDEQLRAIPKHPEAHLWPSEVVTLQTPPMTSWLFRAFGEPGLDHPTGTIP